MKEQIEKKAIEDMAECLIDIQRDFNEYCAKPCRECEMGGIVNCENHYKAGRLYNAGYRKQSECDLVEVANWAGSIEYKCTACKEGFFHAKYYQYCPFCGAKRKGGAE